MYGSESFYHQAKKVRKNLIPTVLWLFWTFFLWKMMWMYLQKVISRKFLFPHPDPLVRGMDPDPDPHQNVMDPEHWWNDLTSSTSASALEVSAPRRSTTGIRTRVLLIRS
jgi:hypothetical protein